ncbi:MAG: division plane positioning ATPase MipZ [Pseudomonadota bacterium]
MTTPSRLTGLLLDHDSPVTHEATPVAPAPGGGPRIITVASAKGGTGKSTTAMHLAIGLLQRGQRIASLDLDGAQGTLTHYLANRAAQAEERGSRLAMPRHLRLAPIDQLDRTQAEHQAETLLDRALAQFDDCDGVVLDTPGNDGPMARLACRRADILITPLNDSFLDLDSLARLDRGKREVLGPSETCRLVWRENDRRVAAGRPPIDWIVMRNRLAHLDARNNREVARLLAQLSQRIGFRLAPGLSERVVYRELFLDGLTLLDQPPSNPRDHFHKSHGRARAEVDELLRSLGAAA